MKSTRERLISAAAALFDKGGSSAVTLRAVAQVVGVSHNAPYKHFKDRNAMLAAVAEADFADLTAVFLKAGAIPKPDTALKQAVSAFFAYGRKHPARYRLLFSDPDIAARGGSLEQAAMQTMQAFARLVAAYQENGHAQELPSRMVTALLYATMHGLMDLELGGRGKPQKGLGDIEAVVHLLLRLLR
jgi:AcrR family transcriptional regulator